MPSSNGICDLLGKDDTKSPIGLNFPKKTRTIFVTPRILKVELWFLCLDYKCDTYVFWNYYVFWNSPHQKLCVLEFSRFLFIVTV